MLLLGFDIGSSSVKVSLLDGENGKVLGSSFYPKAEMAISAPMSGWAEQDPELWWQNLLLAMAELRANCRFDPGSVGAIGISYQMHGLVMLDQSHHVIRPSIIWCDSRAANIGDAAFARIGQQRCLSQLLNSPGNFTASKLKWVKDNESHNYDRLHKMALPGDYIALKLTGTLSTTMGGLSEGILWDFAGSRPAQMVLDEFGIDESVIPDLVPAFGDQGRLTSSAAAALGLTPGIMVGYRAGDQPNNALSLNVMEPGEVAATAGTSGVVYGVSSEVRYDPESRVNTFVHVNHSADRPRLGVLLCINGTGILNAWMRRNTGDYPDYEAMNQLAAQIPSGSEGLVVLPFGNGAERMLRNREVGSVVSGLDFNRHQKGHLLRASQEGVVFSFKYGMEIMRQTGIALQIIKAGRENMFLSSLFGQSLANATGVTIELYNTNGATGAARGAGIGAGYFTGVSDAFLSLERVGMYEPENSALQPMQEAYEAWLKVLQLYL